MTPFSPVSPTAEAPALARRRRVYMFAVAAGTLLVFLGSLVASPHDLYLRSFGPVLVLLGLADLWWLWSPRPLHVAEYGGYAVLAAATMAQIALLSLLPVPPGLYPNSSPYWTLVCTCIIGFLALPPRWAWGANLALLSVCLLVPWLTLSAYAFDHPLLFLRLQGSVLIVNVLLGSMVTLRTQIVETGRSEQTMRVLAFTDPLTGLPNRRAVSPAVEALLADHQRGVPGTLHLIDIDHFKHINDEHGHDVGDLVLMDVARLLSACVTLPGDALPTVGRWGGEEFIVIMPGTDRTLSQRRATALLQEFRRSSWPHGLKVTVSIGSSTVATDDTFGTLLFRADQALYRAKAAGRDRVVLAQET